MTLESLPVNLVEEINILNAEVPVEMMIPCFIDGDGVVHAHENLLRLSYATCRNDRVLCFVNACFDSTVSIGS